MAETLETGGTVALWSGWSVHLPRSCHQRNDDGSWSAWSADWTIDVDIIEAADKAGKPVCQEKMLGDAGAQERIGMPSWVGCFEILVEEDNGKRVFRLAAKLAATGTSMMAKMHSIAF